MKVLQHLCRAAMVCSTACVIAISSAPAQAYTSLSVFGDSLSDVGNVFAGSLGTLPASPYFDGRFSNGPNWVDDLSASLGLGAVRPSLLGGDDYAFGGATASAVIPGSQTGVPTLQGQIAAFSFAHGGTASPTGLYAVWIGSNDVLTALDDIGAGTLTPAQAEADLAIAAQTVASGVNALASQGATDFLIGLVPDLGKTPGLNMVAPAAATNLSALFDQDLFAAVKTTIPAGLHVAYLDTFTLLDTATANPSAYGLTDVKDACYDGPFTGGGTVCSDPSTYLFWDDLHPTATGHRAVAALALSALASGTVSAVPLPGSFALYGSSLIGLAAFAGWSRSRQAPRL